MIKMAGRRFRSAYQSWLQVALQQVLEALEPYNLNLQVLRL